jgi:hypothetical protein
MGILGLLAIVWSLEKSTSSTDGCLKLIVFPIAVCAVALFIGVAIIVFSNWFDQPLPASLTVDGPFVFEGLPKIRERRR